MVSKYRKQILTEQQKKKSEKVLTQHLQELTGYAEENNCQGHKNIIFGSISIFQVVF